MIENLLQTGYPFEVAGLIYFLFYIAMSRGRSKDRFSQRSKTFTLIASIALVASVPFGYGAQPAAIACMLGLVAIALWSTWSDRRTPPPSG
jgi:cobalamin synthase